MGNFSNSRVTVAVSLSSTYHVLKQRSSGRGTVESKIKNPIRTPVLSLSSLALCWTSVSSPVSQCMELC